MPPLHPLFSPCATRALFFCSLAPYSPVEVPRSRQLWDLKKYKIRIDLPGHTDEVYCVDFVADKVVSGGRDKTVKMWVALHFGNPFMLMIAGETKLGCVMSCCAKSAGGVRNVNVGRGVGSGGSPRVSHLASTAMHTCIHCTVHADSRSSHLPYCCMHLSDCRERTHLLLDTRVYS